MVGWEYDSVIQTSYSNMFNIILKDGTRSDNAFTLYGKVKQRYDYFLPHNNRIIKVTIYYGNYIFGFRFHLSDGSNWDIGYTLGGQTVTVDIADNELIVGFKSKSDPDCPAWYVELQFITAV